jgi:pimeloyl-ACP methyl ester carboxylesterase
MDSQVEWVQFLRPSGPSFSWCKLMQQNQPDEIRLEVVDQGNGPPLLLVHGFPLNHSMWQFQVPRFSANRRVIAPDLRGFGKSEVIGDKVTMQQFADDLDSLITALGVDQPIAFCGLSMGGYIGWEFYRRHRDRLSHLVLCDTRAEADSDAVIRGRLMMAARVAEEGPGFIPQTMLPKLFAPETFEQNPELVETAKQVILATSPGGIAAAQRGMASRNSATEILGRMDLPVLLIGGEHDAITPSDEMRRTAAAIPNAQFVEIPGAGHMTPWENPTAFNHAVESFLGMS